MNVPLRLIKKKLFMFFKSLLCLKKSRFFQNMYCSVYYAMQKIFISSALIITSLHINESGIFYMCSFITLIFFVLRYIEEQIIFPVNVPPEARFCVALPSQYNLPYEEISVTTSDGETLSAYLMLQDLSSRQQIPTVVFCHGNAGNMGSRLLNVAQLYKFCHCNVLIFDYRGYGRSTGRPSESGLYLDAQAVIDYLITVRSGDIDCGNIVIFGRSLGGAVAIEMALRNTNGNYENLNNKANLSAVIIENTFTSIPAAAKYLFKIPYDHFLPDWVLRNQFQSLSKIDRLKLPVLLLSGDKDAFIPPAMMMELYSRCPPMNKSFHRIPNGDHNNTWTRPGYFEAINSFLVALVPRKHEMIFVKTI